METPGVRMYFKALQHIFELQSKTLTHVLPHCGERGANDVLRFREFLTRVLPRKFSLGTGFIVCSEPGLPPSGQTDVVIYDEILNSPLHRELAALVYPIETVYAAIEVKGVLTKDNLKKALADIARIRRLANHGWHMQYVSEPKDPRNPSQCIVRGRESKIPLPPRTYVFAYEQRGWQSLEEFADFLQQALQDEKEAYLHGVLVLDKDWFCTQVPFDENRTVKSYGNDSLMRFTKHLVDSINSVPMATASLNRYFQDLSW